MKISVIIIACTLLQSQSHIIPTISSRDHNENQIQSVINHAKDFTLQSAIESANIAENLIKEDTETEDFATGSQKMRSHKKPPLFIKLVHDKISKDESKLLVSADHSGPLLRAWLPVEISRNETTKTTTIRFHQTVNRENIGKFTDARIVLSLRDEVKLAEVGWWTLNILFPDKNTSSKPINSKIRFYDFNITNYLRDSLAEKIEHPVSIVFDFQIVHDGNVLFLGELFDVQVEQPFLLLQYQTFPESLFSSITSRHEIHRRSSRSIPESATVPASNSTAPETTTLAASNSTAPETTTAGPLNPPPLIVGNQTIIPSPSIEPPSKTCCRRHSLVVNPRELRWDNVFEPLSFDLGYCSGSCPYPINNNDYYNHTLHTILLDVYRLNKGFDIPSNLPHSTCVPTKYKDVDVMVDCEDDEKAYEVRRYKTILVSECGCR